MNSPTGTTTGTTARYAGIDWASADHAVCVLDQDGSVVRRLTVGHTRSELRRLVELLGELGVARVGIERPDGPVVEALLGAQLPVAVVAPRMVKNLRSRHRGAGKDDRFAAVPALVDRRRAWVRPHVARGAAEQNNAPSKSTT
jgi:hypothetical protein